MEVKSEITIAKKDINELLQTYVSEKLGMEVDTIKWIDETCVITTVRKSVASINDVLVIPEKTNGSIFTDEEIERFKKAGQNNLESSHAWGAPEPPRKVPTPDVPAPKEEPKAKRTGKKPGPKPGSKKKRIFRGLNDCVHVVLDDNDVISMTDVSHKARALYIARNPGKEHPTFEEIKKKLVQTYYNATHSVSGEVLTRRPGEYHYKARKNRAEAPSPQPPVEEKKKPTEVPEHKKEATASPFEDQEYLNWIRSTGNQILKTRIYDKITVESHGVVIRKMSSLFDVPQFQSIIAGCFNENKPDALDVFVYRGTEIVNSYSFDFTKYYSKN